MLAEGLGGGLRAATARSGAPRVDGINRRLLRQFCRRELLRDTPTRAPRRAPMDRPSAPGLGDLRLDRELVQPTAPSQLLQDAQPDRLRIPTQQRRTCGMITTANLSGEPGEAHIPREPWNVVCE